MDVVDISITTSLNDSYKPTNSSKSYGDHHGAQSSNSSCNSISDEIKFNWILTQPSSDRST